MPARAPDPGTRAAAATASSEVLEGKQILIVEDDASSRGAMKVLLQIAGHEVTVAATLADGMAKLDPSLDTIILDLMLPDGDGAELLARVRQANLKAKVVVTTGVSNPAWLARVQQLRPDVLLHKPVDVEHLLAQL